MPEPRPPAARPIQIGGGGGSSGSGAHGSMSLSKNSSSPKPSPPPSVSAAAAALLIFSPSPTGSGLASSPSSSTSTSAWGVGTPPELQSVFRPTAGGDEGGAATHSLVSLFFFHAMPFYSWSLSPVLAAAALFASP